MCYNIPAEYLLKHVLSNACFIYFSTSFNFPDLRYCVETDLIDDDGLEIKIPSGLRNTIILQSDFRNNPCDALDYDDEEGIYLERISEFIDGSI